MANRSYTTLTIKTLFGQASTCAYPGCEEALIFEDRGATTVVAEIAHIRSEKDAGPRHDPNYVDDIDGPANLLLMCGKHHKPIVDHHSLYTAEELEVWKKAQVAAGSGTPITDAQVQRFTGLTPEERAAVIKLAKLTSRVESACTRLCVALSPVEAALRTAISRVQYAIGPVYAVHEDGTQTPLNGQIQLSLMERNQWKDRFDQVARPLMPAISDAVDALAEEVTVLRMMSPVLGPPAEVVLLAAQNASEHARSEDALNSSLEAMHGALRDLWLSTGAG
jgi:hypothetical protein